MGVPPENVIAVDRKGVLYRGRTEDMNQWKSGPRGRHRQAHPGRGAGRRRRVHRPVGQGRADARSMIKPMAPNPIIFAMANPDPEITPEEVYAVRPDAIVATGRSRTIRTRSTTSWASPTSSAAPSTCAPGGSTRR